MTPPSLHFVVPGPLEQRTGGSLYDARVVEGLRGRGWSVEVHALEGEYPGPDDRSRARLDQALAGLPAGARVVVDGLALGAHPEPARLHGPRLCLLALVHHPLADETGSPDAVREALDDLERRALAACRGVLVTSNFTAGRVAAMDVDPDRIRAVPPGTESAPRATGPPAGAPPCLVTVGAFTPRKGHDVLVEALGRVQDLPWRGVWAGSLERAPAWAAALRARIDAAGLRDRIVLAGECGDEALERIYGQGSVFVFPSHYEGYGMALAEALARGLPVVSTTGGAIPTTVPADAGILAAPGDVDGLADALRAVLTDASRRDRMATAAWRHGSVLPDWGETAEAFGAAVLDLAGRGAVPSPAEATRG